jgi:hypothetical protein
MRYSNSEDIFLWMGTTYLKLKQSHAMETLGGKRRYSSYSFWTSALVGGWVVSVTPRGKGPRYPLYRRLGGRQNWSGYTGQRKNPLCLRRGSNLDRPVVQPVARHFTYWATRLTHKRFFNCTHCKVHAYLGYFKQLLIFHTMLFKQIFAESPLLLSLFTCI